MRRRVARLISCRAHSRSRFESTSLRVYRIASFTDSDNLWVKVGR